MFSDETGVCLWRAAVERSAIQDTDVLFFNVQMKGSLSEKALGFMNAAVLHYYPGFEVAHKRQRLVPFLNFIQTLRGATRRRVHEFYKVILFITFLPRILLHNSDSE